VRLLSNTEAIRHFYKVSAFRDPGRRSSAVTRRVAAALLAFFLLAAGPAADSAPPSAALGDLYRTVEMADLFADQKTFADAVPSQAPTQILIAYERQKRQPDFSLKAFVARYFVLPERSSVLPAGRTDKGIKAYIAAGDDHALARKAGIDRRSDAAHRVIGGLNARRSSFHGGS